MVGSKILLLALVLCISERVLSATVAVTLQPENLYLTTDKSEVGGQVVVTCRADRSSDKLLYLNVKRTLSSGEQALVAWADGLTPNPQGPSMTVTNSTIGTVTTVEVTLHNMKCTDSGNYTCEAGLLSGSADVSSTTDKGTLDVEVIPGNITLTPTPKGQDVWNAGDILEILCNGPVGTVIKNKTQIKWVWEYRKGAGDWEKYTNTSNREDKNGDTSPKCYETRTSKLTLKLTTDDTSREYRCYIERNGMSYTQYAASHSVGTVYPEGYTTTRAPGGGGGGDSGTDKSVVGPIIGGVIGGLILIIIIVVVVVIIVRRRSNREETYAADEPGNKPASDLHAPAPYKPAEVSYGQPPNRFRNSREPQGVSNKAMDETGDKPSPYQPPRYANDFHQGQPNKGYDYDREPGGGRSRHSSDDDGTDSRINTSQLSMGGRGDPSIGTPI